MLDIETTDSLPPVRRGSARPSEERKQIQDAIQSGEINVVKNVEAGNKYNAMQQRIRQAALSVNMKVKIVFRKHEDNPELGDLYFHGYTETTEAPAVKTVSRKSKSDS